MLTKKRLNKIVPGTIITIDWGERAIMLGKLPQDKYADFSVRMLADEGRRRQIDTTDIEGIRWVSKRRNKSPILKEFKPWSITIIGNELRVVVGTYKDVVFVVQDNSNKQFFESGIVSYAKITRDSLDLKHLPKL